MFVKGYKQTEEHKRKIGDALKGRSNSWKGVKRGPMTEEHKQKVSLAKKGQSSWNKGLKGFRAGEKRKPYNYTEKWEQSNRNRRGKLRVESIWNVKYRAKLRDSYVCRICGLEDREIVQVDHIIPIALKPELEYDLDNLQTICPNCHARKTLQDKKLIAIKRRESKP